MKEIEAELRAAMAVFDSERQRERNRRQRQRIVSCCKQVAAFLFSHVGLAAMVVAYSIMGGFLFQALEAPAEQRVRLRVVKFRDDKIEEIWLLAKEMSASQLPSSSFVPMSTRGPRLIPSRATPRPSRVGYRTTYRPTTASSDENDDDEDEASRWRRQNFTEKVGEIFKAFQTEVRQAVKENGWDGNDSTDLSSLQWSFAGALLYAVTVITTIGYGHVAPKTPWGRLLTIVYALVGIPLTFLSLSNIGNFLADCFRLFYKRICCDVLCCEKCDRKRKRQRLKLRKRREMMAAVAEQYNIRFDDERYVDEWDPSHHCADLADHSFDEQLVNENDEQRTFEKPKTHRMVPERDAAPLLQLQSTSGSGSSSAPVSPSNHFPPGVSDLQSTSSWSTTSSAADDDERSEMIENARETAILDDDEDDDDDDDDDEDVESRIGGVRETAIVENSLAYDRRKMRGNGEKQIAIHARFDAASDDDDSATEEQTSPHRASAPRSSSKNIHCSADDIASISRTDDRKQMPRITFGSNPTYEGNATRSSDGKGLRRCLSDKRDRRRSDSNPGGTASNTGNSKRPSVLTGGTAASANSGSRTNRSISSPGQSNTALANWLQLRDMLIMRQLEARANSAHRPPMVITEPQSPAPSAFSLPSSTMARRPLVPLPTKNASQSKVKSRHMSDAGFNSHAATNTSRLPSLGLDRHDRSPPASAPSGGSRLQRIFAKIKFSALRRRANIPDAETPANDIGDNNNSPSMRSPDRSRRLRMRTRGSDESFVTAHSSDDDDDDDDDRHTSGQVPSIGPDGFDDCRSDAAAVTAVGTETTAVTFDDDIPMTSAAKASISMSGFGSPSFHTMSASGFDPFDYEFDGDSSTSSSDDAKVTVPVSICLVIIAGYIFAGAVLFTLWEDWDLLTGSYFCFITLSTIGFGDIVPGTDMDKWASHEKLVLCALWLAFGLSLLAMCFNLMQEEVKEKCKWVGKKLGLLKDDGDVQ